MEYEDSPYDSFSGHRDITIRDRGIDARNWRLNQQLAQIIKRNERKDRDGGEFCPATFIGFQQRMNDGLPDFEGDQILTPAGFVITTVSGFVIIDPKTGHEIELNQN